MLRNNSINSTDDPTVFHKRASAKMKGADFSELVGNIKQRFERAKYNQHVAEQERVAKFKSEHPTHLVPPPEEVSTEEIVASYGNIKERFEAAKLNQQKKEHERITKLKDEHLMIPRASLSQPEDMTNKDLEHKEYLSTDNETTTRFSINGANGRPELNKQQSYVKHVWEKALDKTKEKEQSRTKELREQNLMHTTITPSGSNENLQPDSFASRSQPTEHIQPHSGSFAAKRSFTAHNASSINLVDVTTDIKQTTPQENNDEIAESFVIGDTHTYNASYLPKHVVSFLTKALDLIMPNSSDLFQLPLSCGVYTQVGKKPGILGSAFAFRSENNNLIYISLSIRAADGADEDGTAYGVKKLAIYAKGLEGNILRRLLDIVKDDPDNTIIKQVKNGHEAIEEKKIHDAEEAAIAFASVLKSNGANEKQPVQASKFVMHDITEDVDGTSKPQSFQTQTTVTVTSATPNTESEVSAFAELPETFILGETHTYNATYLPRHLVDFLSKSLNALKEDPTNASERILLSCGLYADPSEVSDGKNPAASIKAIATAYHGKSTTQFYISLTVRAADGFETDNQALGIKRIAIYSPEVKGIIMQRLLDLVPAHPDKSNVLLPIGLPSSIPAMSRAKTITTSTDKDAFTSNATTSPKPYRVNKSQMTITDPDMNKFSIRDISEDNPTRISMKLDPTLLQGLLDPSPKTPISKAAAFSAASTPTRKVDMHEMGIVRKRMSAFQQIYVQPPGTERQMEEIAKIAAFISYTEEGIERETAQLDSFLSDPNAKPHMKRIFEGRSRFDSEVQDVDNSSELFVLGDTHLYDLNTLPIDIDQSVTDLIKLSTTSSVHYPLTCSLQIVNGSNKPPLLIYAAIVETRPNPIIAECKIHLTITIRAVKGHENDPDAFGVKRILVSCKDIENGDKILERVVNIIPPNKAKDIAPITIADVGDFVPPTQGNSRQSVREKLKEKEEKYLAITGGREFEGADPNQLGSGDERASMDGEWSRLHSTSNSGEYIVKGPTVKGMISPQQSIKEKKIKKVLTNAELIDSGLVKKRIGVFEQIFIQSPPTDFQVNDTFNGAVGVLREQNDASSSPNNESVESFLESCKVAINFRIGETQIYKTSKLLPQTQEYLKKKVAANPESTHFALSCGVYGDRSRKPPLNACAIAFVSTESSRSSDIYLALTIKALPGHEYDPSLYGTKKISIFAKDFEENIMERLVDIIPASTATLGEDQILGAQLTASSSESFDNVPGDTSATSKILEMEQSINSKCLTKSNSNLSELNIEDKAVADTNAEEVDDEDDEDGYMKLQEAILRVDLDDGVDILPDAVSSPGVSMVNEPSDERKNTVEVSVKQMPPLRGAASFFLGLQQQSVSKKDYTASGEQQNQTNRDNLTQSDERFEDQEYDLLYSLIVGGTSFYATSDADPYVRSILLRLRASDSVATVLELFHEIFSSKISPTNHLILSEIMAACMLHTASRFCTSFVNIEEFGSDRNFVRQVLLVGSLHPTSLIVSEKLMFCVGNLSIVIENRPKLSSFGANDVVVKLINKYGGGSPFIAKHGLLAIGNLAGGNIATKSKLVALGASNLIMSMLELHGEKSPVIVRNGLFAIANLTSDNEERRSQFITMGLFEMLIHFLQLHGVGTATVAYNGLRVMGNMAVTDDDTARLIRMGCCEIIVKLLQAHYRSSISVVQYGLVAIGNVCSGNSDAKHKFVKLEACELIVLMMQMYGQKNVIVARNGFFAIANLISNQSVALMEFSPLSTFELVIDLLSSHGDTNGPLAQYGMLCLGNLACEESARGRLTELGACELVVNLLSKHGEYKINLSDNGLRTIANLCLLHENIEKFGSIGSCNVVVRQLMVHSQSQSLTQYGTLVISRLSVDPSNVCIFANTPCCATLIYILQSSAVIPTHNNIIANHVASAFYNMVVLNKNKTICNQLIEINARSILKSLISKASAIYDSDAKDFAAKVRKVLKGKRFGLF